MQGHGRTGTENALNRRDYYRFTTTPGGSPLAGDYECLYVPFHVEFFFSCRIVPRHFLPIPRFCVIATVLEFVSIVVPCISSLLLIISLCFPFNLSVSSLSVSLFWRYHCYHYYHPMNWNWNWHVKLFLAGTSVDLFIKHTHTNIQPPFQSELLPVCHTDIYTLDGHDPEGTS